MNKLVNRIETDVVVTLARVMGGKPDQAWRLRIYDRRSRVEVLELRMDNDTFADMMSSTEAGKTAKAEIVTGPPAQNWGKYAIHHSEQVDTRHIPYAYLHERLTALGKEKARELRRRDFAMDYEWQFTGYHGGGGGSPMRTMTFVRYTDEKPDDAR